MKRDWEVVRSVLIEIENLSPAETNNFQYVEEYSSSEDSSERARHALMLLDAGYIDGIRTATYSDGIYLTAPKLNMKGADFLDTIRNETTWNKIKKVGAEKGIGLAFDSIKSIGVFVVKQLLDN